MATLTPERVDAEIQKQRAALLDLFVRKNSFLPVSRLPPETLANIFILGARDYHERNALTDFCVPSWVNVSYVCRHWRNVALNCPTLWSYHFTVSLRWTEELLARSKQVSLKIRLSSESRRKRTQHWWECLVTQLLDHVERTEELHLCVPCMALPPTLPLRAPCLRVLDISVAGGSASHWWSILVEGDAPCLRTLKLTSCPLQWDSLNLSALTALFLCRVPVRSQQNTKDFLAALCRMQALTVLHLENALAAHGGISDEGFDVSQKIDLPHLTRLFVAAPLSTAITLLSCITIPLKTEVRLQFKLEHGSSIDDYAQISSILAQRFSKDLLPVGPTIRSLGIQFCLRKARFTLWASQQNDREHLLSVKDPRWDSNIPLVVLIEVGHSIMIEQVLRERIISDMCCSIPPTDVQSLCIICPPNLLDFWRKILGHLEDLQHIKLCHGTMPDLTSLLELNASGEHCTFVPALKWLELCHMKFSFEVSHERLISALSTRKTYPGLIVNDYGDGNELDMMDDDSDESSESGYSGLDSELDEDT